jgi:hypothetical protein
MKLRIGGPVWLTFLFLASPIYGPTAPLPTTPYDAAQNLQEVYSWVAAQNLQKVCRNVDCLDLFSGRGNFAKVGREEGFNVETYEMRHDPSSQDFRTKAGFFEALGIVLRIAPQGIILTGPPCSLWIFLSSGFHCRTKIET